MHLQNYLNPTNTTRKPHTSLENIHLFSNLIPYFRDSPFSFPIPHSPLFILGVAELFLEAFRI